MHTRLIGDTLMKITCMVAMNESFQGETPFLEVRVLLNSHAIVSPLADECMEWDEGEEDLSSIALGTLRYPCGENPLMVLPPFLLLEPCDDPETAKQGYEEWGGYHYIGQCFLGEVLGERVDVIITAPALALWQARFPQSASHQQALAGHASDRATLFVLEPEDLPTPTLPEDLAQHVEKAVALLARATPAEQMAGFALLQDLPGEALPLEVLFRCLGDANPAIQQAALSQLLCAPERLPEPRLSLISSQGSLRERIAAITLLGAIGTEEAVLDLQCISVCESYRREHADERIAVIQALAKACHSPLLDSIDVVDICATVERVAAADPLQKVREVALSLVEDLSSLTQKGKSRMFDIQKLAVFVPASAAVPIARIVARGSAIVGKAESDEAVQVTVDYEGNINGAGNIKTFADRARHAAGRQSVLYPSIARSVVPHGALCQVGWYDPENGITLIDNPQAKEALASWLGVEDLDPRELRLSDL